MKKLTPLKISGITEDGKFVVSGIYKLKSTYGIPLEVSIQQLTLKNSIPDWLDLYKDSIKNGISWKKRLRGELSYLILDLYDKKTRDVVICILDKIDEVGLDNIRFMLNRQSEINEENGFR